MLVSRKLLLYKAWGRELLCACGFEKFKRVRVEIGIFGKHVTFLGSRCCLKLRSETVCIHMLICIGER